MHGAVCKAARLKAAVGADAATAKMFKAAVRAYWAGEMENYPT